MEIIKDPACKTEVCPVCGVRLSFFEGVCFCPSEYCGWKCSKCAEAAKEGEKSFTKG